MVRRDSVDEQFFRGLYRKLGIIGVAAVKPFIPSATLQDELHFIINRGREEGISLQFKSYWARFVHDGRGPVLPEQAQFVVFFRNARLDDPRVAGGYPQKTSEIRQLTRSEFQFGLQLNTAARQAGLPPPMIVMRTEDFRAIPTGPAEGSFFFERPELRDAFFDAIEQELWDHIDTTVLKVGTRRRRRNSVALRIRL